MSNQTIYIDLDSLLDTRVGALSLLDDNYPIQLFGNGYFERGTDKLWQLCDVNEEAYLAKYRTRDVSVLQRSHMTGMVSVLQTMVGKLNEEATVNPVMDAAAIHINTYPYKLQGELKDAIKQCVLHYVGLNTKITLSTISPSFLSPTYIKSKFPIVMMYDFVAWYTVQGRALEECPLSDNVFFVPKLVTNPLKEQKDSIQLDGKRVNISKLKDIDVFSGLSIAMAGYVNFQFIDVKDFSVTQPA